MTKLLSQVLATEPGIRTKTDTEGADLKRVLGKDVLVTGQARVYTPDEGGLQLPDDSKLVQVKVPEVLGRLAFLMTDLFDTVLTKEASNAVAKADLVIDGKPLLAAVPVTYLLFLTHQLDELAKFVDGIPTLDPAFRWEWNEGTEQFETGEIETIQKAKTRGVQVLYPATPEHPAQVESFIDDAPVGRWRTRKISGAIYASRKRELADRVDRLRAAVKSAREKANTIEATERTAGAAVFGYLFAN